MKRNPKRIELKAPLPKQDKPGVVRGTTRAKRSTVKAVATIRFDPWINSWRWNNPDGTGLQGSGICCSRAACEVALTRARRIAHQVEARVAVVVF
jgi:hypothetical protein